MLSKIVEWEVERIKSLLYLQKKVRPKFKKYEESDLRFSPRKTEQAYLYQVAGGELEILIMEGKMLLQ